MFKDGMLEKNNHSPSNILILNELLDIKQYGDKQSEYKIRLNISENEFLILLKNKQEVLLNLKILNYWNVELINCIGSYINQYLSSYHTMSIYMPYIKYCRQERKTYDDCDQLTPYLDSILYFDTIYTLYLHNNLYTHKNKNIILIRATQKNIYNFDNFNVLFADNGLKKRANEIYSIFNFDTTKALYCFEKERICDKVITKMPQDLIIENDQEYVIVDDIIAGGLTMVNAIKLLAEKVCLENIHITTIYMMSDYSIYALLDFGIKKENIHYIYKVNK